MDNSSKTMAISAFGGLILGLLLGFLPEHSANSKLQDQNSSLTQGRTEIQNELDLARQRLQLSSFAVRSAEVSSQAQSNNYSVASATASSLFTDLRQYVGSNQKSDVTQQMTEVLGARDRVIAGLAQANPAVKPLLEQVFARLENVSAAANQSK